MAEMVSEELYLVFSQGAERYALALTEVDEVLEPPPLAFVPWAPLLCLGGFSHQGQILAVLDAGALLAAEAGASGPATGEPPDALTRFVVVGYGEYRFALRVDRVDRISPLTGGAEVRGGGETAAGGAWLEGVFSEPEGIINKINTGALVESVDRLFQG